MQPLVTIVCLCYNQAEFVQEAILSIINQTYQNIEIIVIDDFSTDNSVSQIHQLIENYPSISFIQNSKNLGNCKAFNIVLALAKGKYIIDFSCDDIALANRIQQQVAFFEAQQEETGFIYSNATYFFTNSNQKYNHFSHKTTWKPCSGWVYTEILSEYFIPTATMMYNTKILKEFGGFDENLAYEDFDIWIRIGRKYPIKYQDEITTLIRKSENSMSTKLYQPNDKQLYSTYLVCKKAQLLNTTKEENHALAKRVKYELRMCFLYGLKNEFQLFYNLLSEINELNIVYYFYKIALNLNLKFRK